MSFTYQDPQTGETYFFEDEPEPGVIRPDLVLLTPEQVAALPQPAVPVPATVSRAQGKAALIQAGYWTAVIAFVDAIEDPTIKALAEVALYDTTEWRRDSPFLNQAAANLGISDEALDALFIAADAVVL